MLFESTIEIIYIVIVVVVVATVETTAAVTHHHISVVVERYAMATGRRCCFSVECSYELVKYVPSFLHTHNHDIFLFFIYFHISYYLQQFYM